MVSLSEACTFISVRTETLRKLISAQEVQNLYKQEILYMIEKILCELEDRESSQRVFQKLEHLDLIPNFTACDPLEKDKAVKFLISLGEHEIVKLSKISKAKVLRKMLL